MKYSVDITTDPQTAANEMLLAVAVSTKTDIDVNRIKKMAIRRKAIDARQRNIKINLSIDVWLDTLPTDTLPYNPIKYPKLSEASQSAIIVGAGPAGLFAALKLIELGIKPIILERGKDVDNRRKDLVRISREQTIDSNSNYCFGEGGAGAFSDGKLYTRSKKRGDVSKILAVLHQFGASDSILSDAHPHIGSDRLPQIIKNIRNRIIDSGGEVHFSTCVTKLLLENNKCVGVVTSDEKIFSGKVILATGHSARDVYKMLNSLNVEMEPKGIAVGVRLQHPQKLIDKIMYHNPNGRGKFLPPAEYSLLCRVDDRAVYSFCMCPGGVIIPAATENNQIVVNGMSASGRQGKWANSGLVVEIQPQDIAGADILKIMNFQEQIERKFHNSNPLKNQSAPAQRMKDFVNGKKSESLPPSSYQPGIHSSRIDLLLPDFISKRLQKAFEIFGKRYKGFLTDDALLIGCETRTSSPVRIPRNKENLQHIRFEGLYPCGEGAGYAGGIVSAAIDGELSACALADDLKNKNLNI